MASPPFSTILVPKLYKVDKNHTRAVQLYEIVQKIINNIMKLAALLAHCLP